MDHAPCRCPPCEPGSDGCHYPHVRVTRRGAVGSVCELDGLCWLEATRKNDDGSKGVRASGEGDS